MRRFEIISDKQWNKDIPTQKDEVIQLGYQKPHRSTKHSAGYDFYSPIATTIPAHKMVVIPTGIKAQMENDEVLSIYPRSGIGFKTGIRLANTVGIIDSDYYNNEDNEGHIFIKIYNTSDNDFVVNVGDRFAQGIFTKFLIVDDEDAINSERQGGLGSTNNS